MTSPEGRNKVHTKKTELLDAFVECNNCFHRGRSKVSMDAARKEAHRHAAETGHTVEVTAVRVYTYEQQPVGLTCTNCGKVVKARYELEPGSGRCDSCRT